MLTKSELTLLGSRLTKLRAERGVSAAQVAHEALGYENKSHVAVSRLERATLAHPRQDHLQALATYYGVEPEHLMVDKAKGQASAIASEATQTLAPVPSAPAKPIAVSLVDADSPVVAPVRRGPLPRTLAGRIAHVREAAGLAPSAFAAALTRHGAIITCGNVESWENGGTPNPVQLRALARWANRSE